MPKERSLFAEAGLDPEVPPQTWEEWADHPARGGGHVHLHDARGVVLFAVNRSDNEAAEVRVAV